jgi:hypothetical protein
MRKTLMVTTAAVVVIASTALNAQTGKEGESGALSAGPEQHSGGAGGATKPTQGSTEQKGGSQHIGQSAPGAKSSERMGEESGKGSAQHPTAGNAEGHDKAGQADTKERSGPTETKGRSAADSEQNKERAGRGETKERTGQGENRDRERTGQGERREQVGGDKKGERTGKSEMRGGGKGGSVQLSREQHTKIHEVIIHDRSAVIDHVDFSVSVGTAVPHSVRVYDVPTDIVEIVPEYRGFRYFIVRDEIVIVDPESQEIVAIIPA